MEQKIDAMEMLDLMVRPAFCVKDGVILRVNSAAEQHLLIPGTKIESLLITGKEEYEQLQDGCLYLTLSIGSCPCGVSVTRKPDFDVFILEQEADQSQLQAMALAAKELRGPLASVMTVADRLFPMVSDENDPAREQISRINRGLFQMLRVISNMSDAARYSGEDQGCFEMRDVNSFLEEIIHQAGELIRHTEVSLQFTGLDKPVYSLIDCEKLERAVNNILSNAVKFTPKGGTIQVRLSWQGSKLYLTVQDSGQGIPEKLRGNVYSRYLRQPGVEDGRFGIGLGMVLIRSAAATHGGTVLIEAPEGRGTRITMTLSVRQDGADSLRSDILKVDYAGERSHRLIELSDCLPASLYDKKNIN